MKRVTMLPEKRMNVSTSGLLPKPALFRFTVSMMLWSSAMVGYPAILTSAAR